MPLRLRAHTAHKELGRRQPAAATNPAEKRLHTGLQGMPAGTPCRPTLHHAGQYAGHLLLKGPMWARTPLRPGSASFPSSPGHFRGDSARAECLAQSQKSRPCLHLLHLIMPDCEPLTSKRTACPALPPPLRFLHARSSLAASASVCSTMPCVVATAMLGVLPCPSTAFSARLCGDGGAAAATVVRARTQAWSTARWSSTSLRRHGGNNSTDDVGALPRMT